jgi:beta-lactamase regulating signal transducer with metallopeptidase domain
MIMVTPSNLFGTVHAESARVVTAVYTMALVALVPILVAAFAGWLARRATADARTTVWRSAIVALVVVIAGRQVPMYWMAWVVPSFFAAPLVALGRVQVTADSAHSIGLARDGATSGAGTIALVALIVYLAGVVIVTTRTLVAFYRLRRAVNSAAVVDTDLTSAAADVLPPSWWRRAPSVLSSPAATVPMTWGWVHPVVVLPAVWSQWSDSQRRMALIHELAHARANDWAFHVIARAVCALLWFHPGVWWVARALRDDCEQACDDRVVASGVRRSDYAELLVRALDRRSVTVVPALALSRRRGLRGRLAAVLDPGHDVRPIGRSRAVAAALVAVTAAAPLSVVQLAPTRAVLTNLMLSAQWESRAYAVLGLAERADSVAVARSAAELDPNPRVRAWARYALDHRGVLPALVPVTGERQ